MKTAQQITGLPLGGRALSLVAMTVALMFLVFSSSALASSSPPEVQIEPAEQTPTGFMLKAKVNPKGSATTYYFIYKDTGVECEDLEGCGPTTPQGGPLTGDTQQEVQAEVTGLTPGRQYRYWLIAHNASPEAVRSGELTFTTPPGRPVIESVSVSGITEHDATLEAQIDPSGLLTTYEFWIEYGCGIGNHDSCMWLASKSVGHGQIAAGDEAQAVSVDADLEPGNSYNYWVVATNSDGETSRSGGLFSTPGPGSGAPMIESVSISHLTPTDATLEAQIDTEGLSALFQFHLVMVPLACDAIPACLGQTYSLPSGNLLGSFIGQTVNLDLNSAGVSLKPGREYVYWASAISTAGTTEGPSQTFEAPSGVFEPLGTKTSTPPGPDQPAGSNGNGQPTGSGDSSSSSPPPPSIGVLGARVGKTTELKPLTKAEKLADALKACEKRPANKRAACEKQVRKKYGATAKKSKQ
jgi:hypothetical protein